MNFYIRTLGCKMNWLDSARVSAALQSVGHIQVDTEEKADFVFINTCTVTSEADRKSRQITQKAVNLNKQVAVIGCSPKVNQQLWDHKQKQATIFTDEKQLFHFFDINPDDLPYPGSTGRTRYPIAIQGGCDNTCSFCITRVARGNHFNIPSSKIIEQIHFAEEQGIKEIVLTGINMAAWGCDDTNKPEQSRLNELLEQILMQTTIPRIRLSSIGPEYIQQGFFDVYADTRICDYLHISVQSGSNSVLQRMNRNHGTDEIFYIAENARKLRADSAIACDLIVGFPGETEDEFNQTCDFIKEIEFSKMHVFPFSVREGTDAAQLSFQIDSKLKKQRAAIIRDTANKMRNDFIQSQLGTTHKVLTEGGGTGLSGNYIRISTPECEEGEINNMTITSENLIV